jgi:hypothetical protein
VYNKVHNDKNMEFEELWPGEIISLKVPIVNIKITPK